MTFYVVKGAADACGRGCDRWIEAEGTIQSDTAARFKAFLNRLKDSNLPIYFESPGGNLDSAVAMGSFLHAKPNTARVGRSVVAECGFEAQNGDVCFKLKQSGRELHGSLLTRGAICGSACPYVFAGARVHELAPDAFLAIHSPKVILDFHGGPVNPLLAAIANERGRDRADRLVAGYLARMGIDLGLLTLTRTVKFEDIHVLTRDEIARFGLDRREIAETPWTFEGGALNMAHKLAFVKTAGDSSYRLLQWRVRCFDADSFALDFQRPIPPPGSKTVSLSQDDANPVFFNGPIKGSDVEQWGMRLLRSRLDALINHPQIEIIETSAAADGRLMPHSIKLSNDGWADAVQTLISACPGSKGELVVQTSSQTSKSGGGTAK